MAQQANSTPATDTPTLVVLDSINHTSDPRDAGWNAASLEADVQDETAPPYGFIRFQDGPVREVGVNGTSLEVVLQALIERLEGYQRGPFPCVENALALEAGRMMMGALDLRTAARRSQGVEGVNVPHEQPLATVELTPETREAWERMARAAESVDALLAESGIG